MASPASRALRLCAALVVVLLLIVAGCGPTERKIKTRALPVGDDHQVLWTHNMLATVIPGPAIDRAGDVLTSSTDGTLYALDAATGETNWDFHGFGDFNGPVSTAALTLPSGLIAWPGPADTLYGLSATGAPLWKVQFRSQVFTPVAGKHGRIYVADRGGHMTALDVSSSAAKVAWTVTLGAGGSAGNPASLGAGEVVGTAGNELVAVRDDGASGKVAWKFGTDATIPSSPAVAPGGTVAVASDDGFLYGVSSAGKQRWQHRLDAASASSPLAAPDGKLYIGAGGSTVATLDAATGRVLASVHAIGVVRARPALGPDGAVYVGTQNGWIQGFTAAGAQLFAIKTGGPIVATPIVDSSGVLFVGSSDQFLYAVKPR